MPLYTGGSRHKNDFAHCSCCQTRLQELSYEQLIQTWCLSVAAMPRLHLEHLWVAFGTGQYFKYIPAHEIAGSIGPERATALPVFYDYIGCDIVSSFATIGKRLAWQTWNAFDDVTATFCTLGDAPRDIDDEAMATLERITVLLYDRTSDMDNIDEVLQHLFTKRGSSIESLPPTKAALVHHAKRAVHQAGHIWGKHLMPLLPFHLQEIGVGQIRQNGNHCGQPFLRPAFPQESCYAVDAKKAAEVAANVTRQPCRVLLSVSVGVTAKPNQ